MGNPVFRIGIPMLMNVDQLALALKLVGAVDIGTVTTVRKVQIKMNRCVGGVPRQQLTCEPSVQRLWLLPVGGERFAL